MKNWRVRGAAIVGSLAFTTAVIERATAHGRIPQDVPVDRLVENLKSYVENHPQDAEGFYRLGRVHTLALETKIEFVPAFDHDAFPKPAEGSWARRDWAVKKDAKPSTPEQLREHLREAISNLNTAIRLRPMAASYRLTLACALEAGASMKAEVVAWPLMPTGERGRPAEGDRQDSDEYSRRQVEASLKTPGGIDSLVDQMRKDDRLGDQRQSIMTAAYALRDQPAYKVAVEKLRQADWTEQIEHQFFTAMCLALPSNGRAEEKPIWGGMRDWVSYEAGEAFIRIVESRTAGPTDSIRLKVAKEVIKAFDALPQPNAITPIILRTDAAGPLDSLVAPATHVAFDLDGTGRPQTWSWVKPDTGILVWDPDKTDKITSGRQLFGNVSWWIFFRDGYQALAALDDNGDGEVAGAELNGLAVWFDRNSNGISDPGEVTPVEQLSIAALATKSTGIDGESLVSEHGVRFADGRVLPTYDWVTSPLPAKTDPMPAK